MSGDDDQLKIILDDLARLSGQPPPPQIPPDQLATGKSAISQLLALLGIASNGGDPDDSLDAATGHAERGAKTDDALTKFPANEEVSSAKLASVGGQDPMGQMVQQLPQLASGMAGALGGLFQPLAQIPQQVAQVGQQAMQAGMGALQHGAGGAAAAGEEIPTELLGSTSDAGEFAGAGAGGGTGGGGLGATTPTAMLGPLPPSAGTEPASAHSASPAPTNPPPPAAGPRGAMGGMPMMPPGAMQGGGGAGSDAKPDTKRIVAPSVKNGAPVQGRITTPPPVPEVTKRVDGKPIASRRILLPEQKRDDEDAGASR